MKPNERILKAKKISIIDYLSSLGFNFLKDSANYYFYLSPLPGRNEKKPSFIIRKKDLKWSDRGLNNKWGDIIDLVMTMNNCNIHTALDILLGHYDIKKVINKEELNYNYEPAIIIDDVFELKSKSLINELIRRKVDVDIARLYCKEAIVKFPNSKYRPEKKYNFIAFKNDLGGYELRNRRMKRSNSPKFYTTIPGINEDRIFFEGFINFLSLLTLNGIDKTEDTVYVLNSLIYLPQLFSLMKTPGINYMYLDWGHAAEKKYQELKDECIEFEDCRDIYYLYDDLNDMLRNYARIK